MQSPLQRPRVQSQPASLCCTLSPHSLSSPFCLIFSCPTSVLHKLLLNISLYPGLKERNLLCLGIMCSLARITFKCPEQIWTWYGSQIERVTPRPTRMAKCFRAEPNESSSQIRTRIYEVPQSRKSFLGQGAKALQHFVNVPNAPGLLTWFQEMLNDKRWFSQKNSFDTEAILILKRLCPTDWMSPA